MLEGFGRAANLSERINASSYAAPDTPTCLVVALAKREASRYAVVHRLRDERRLAKADQPSSLRASIMRSLLDRPRPKIHILQLSRIKIPNSVKRCGPMRSDRQIRFIIGEQVQ